MTTNVRRNANITSFLFFRNILIVINSFGLVYQHNSKFPVSSCCHGNVLPHLTGKNSLKRQPIQWKIEYNLRKQIKKHTWNRLDLFNGWSKNDRLCQSRDCENHEILKLQVILLFSEIILTNEQINHKMEGMVSGQQFSIIINKTINNTLTRVCSKAFLSWYTFAYNFLIMYISSKLFYTSLMTSEQ